MDPQAVAIRQDGVFGIGIASSDESATPGALALAVSTVAGDELADLLAHEVKTRPFELNASDIELCRLAAGGDIAAFELIYERYHRRTYSLCLRMTSSQTEAEDLTQEVFIQLFRKVGSFRGDSAFSTWLHRLTVNQVLMHFRKRSVKNERVSEDGEIPEQMVHGTANPNRMQVVDRIALKNAIAQLPNGYRNVFVLHDVEGFEHEEVARQMGISVGTSKSQLHKARLKLRGLLIRKTD